MARVIVYLKNWTSKCTQLSSQPLCQRSPPAYRWKHLPAKISCPSKTHLMHHKGPTTALLSVLLSTIVPSSHTQPTNNASTIPTTTTDSNTSIPFSIQTLLASNAAVTCTPFKPFHFRPTYQDCSAAIRLLPDSPKPGPFHTGWPADEFSLPVNKIIRTCKIEVRLADAYTGVVTGTWKEIKNAAGLVAETCYNGRGLENTGGEVLLGKRILVSLIRASSIIVGGLNNPTIAGEY